MFSKLKSLFADILCGAVAYVLARWIFSGGAGVFDNLHWELITFGVFYGLLQLLIRGWRMARKGRAG